MGLVKGKIESIRSGIDELTGVDIATVVTDNGVCEVNIGQNSDLKPAQTVEIRTTTTNFGLGKIFETVLVART